MPPNWPRKTAANAAAANEETKEPEADVGPEIEPTYETEMQHKSVSQFKKAVGLFADNYKLNYAITNYSKL